jgi:hypothetical protein
MCRDSLDLLKVSSNGGLEPDSKTEPHFLENLKLMEVSCLLRFSI